MGDSIKNERFLLLLLPTETLHDVLECVCDSIVMSKLTLPNSILIQTLWAQKFNLSVSLYEDVKARGERRSRLLIWANKTNLGMCMSLWKKRRKCSGFVITMQHRTLVKHRTCFYMWQKARWHMPVCHYCTEVWSCNSYIVYLLCGETTEHNSWGDL